MPTYDRSTGEAVDEITFAIPEGLDVRRVVVRNLEVSFFDASDRESVLVQRPFGPGAGLSVQFADHVNGERA